MRSVDWIMVVTMFVLAGCSHGQKNPEVSTNAPVAQAASEAAEQGEPEQPPVVDAVVLTDEGGQIEAEFLDEDLDFLEEEGFEDPILYVSDPLAPWNRMMFQFNDKLYFCVLKPVSTGYKAAVPGPVRKSVQNFFNNLAAPVRVGSCLVQGKGTEAQAEFSRFFFNSTFGIFGLGNPAEAFPHLKEAHDEDMGQALAVHGVGEGYYVVWPILGPSTFRDSAGAVGDMFMNPISYLPLGASLGLSGEKNLNSASYRIDDYETLKEAAVDPYEAIRDAYIQHRRAKIEQ